MKTAFVGKSEFPVLYRGSKTRKIVQSGPVQQEMEVEPIMEVHGGMISLSVKLHRPGQDPFKWSYGLRSNGIVMGYRGLKTLEAMTTLSEDLVAGAIVSNLPESESDGVAARVRGYLPEPQMFDKIAVATPSNLVELLTVLRDHEIGYSTRALCDEVTAGRIKSTPELALLGVESVADREARQRRREAFGKKLEARFRNFGGLSAHGPFCGCVARAGQIAADSYEKGVEDEDLLVGLGLQSLTDSRGQLESALSGLLSMLTGGDVISTPTVLADATEVAAFLVKEYGGKRTQAEYVKALTDVRERWQTMKRVRLI